MALRDPRVTKARMARSVFRVFLVFLAASVPTGRTETPEPLVTMALWVCVVSRVRWVLLALVAQPELLALLDPSVSVDLTVSRAPSGLWVLPVPLATLVHKGLLVTSVPSAPVVLLAPLVQMARRALTHLQVGLAIVVTEVCKESGVLQAHPARKVSRARRGKKAVMVVVAKKASWATRVIRASLAAVVLMAVAIPVLKGPKVSRGRKATKVLPGRVQVARPALSALRATQARWGTLDPRATPVLSALRGHLVGLASKVTWATPAPSVALVTVVALATLVIRVPRVTPVRRGLLAPRVRSACAAPRDPLERTGRAARSVKKAPWASPESKASVALKVTVAVLAPRVLLGTRVQRVSVVSLAVLASWARREILASVAHEATRAPLAALG